MSEVIPEDEDRGGDGAIGGTDDDTMPDDSRPDDTQPDETGPDHTEPDDTQGGGGAYDDGPGSQTM